MKKIQIYIFSIFLLGLLFLAGCQVINEDTVGSRLLPQQTETLPAQTETPGQVQIPPSISTSGSGGGSGGGSSSGSFDNSITGVVFLGENLGENPVFSTGVDARDLPFLFDGVITFGGRDYDVSEQLYFSQRNNLSLQTSLLSGEDAYESNIVMEVEKGALEYLYSFDSPIDLKQVTSTNPLQLELSDDTFLTLIGVSGPNSFSAYVGKGLFIDGGEGTTSFKDWKLTLIQMGSNGDIRFDVNGITDILANGQTKVINGLRVTNLAQFYSGLGVTADAVYVVVAPDQLEIIRDGQVYFGGDNSCGNTAEDSDCWKFIVKNMDRTGTTSVTNTPQNGIAYGTGPVLGLKGDFALNDNTDNPPQVGECINLPNDYVSVCFKSLNTNDDENMLLTFERDTGFDSETAEAGVSSLATSAILIDSSFKGSFFLNVTGVNADKIWLAGHNQTHAGVYYEDMNGVTHLDSFVGKGTSFLGFLEPNIGSFYTNYNVDNMGKGDIAVTLSPAFSGYSGVDAIFSKWNLINYSVNSLGAIPSFSEASELLWEGVSIGTKDEDHRTRFGIIIRDPKLNGASDSVKLEIPTEQVTGNILVGKPSVVILGDYNGNGCIDASSDGTVTIGEEWDAFIKYYNDQDKRADLDSNGVVEFEDFVLFATQTQNNGCEFPVRSNEYFLDFFESVTVDGKIVILKEVRSDGRIFVAVETLDGKIEESFINFQESVVINGLKITNFKYFYDSNIIINSAASLIIEIADVDTGETCVDSDAKDNTNVNYGDSHYIKGTLYKNGQPIAVDSCNSAPVLCNNNVVGCKGDYLIEWYFASPIEACDQQWAAFKCPNGCKDGSCDETLTPPSSEDVFFNTQETLTLFGAKVQLLEVYRNSVKVSLSHKEKPMHISVGDSCMGVYVTEVFYAAPSSSSNAATLTVSPDVATSTSCKQQKGDGDNDGDVDFEDYNLFNTAFSNPLKYTVVFDFDDDRDVDFTDFTMFAQIQQS